MKISYKGKLGITTLLLSFSVLITQGQPEKAAFRNLTSAQGLPNTSVADVTQDALGLIWIATWDGVYRYDGRTYKQISGKDCRKIAGDNQGGIWMSFTQSGTVGYYDARTDSLKYYGVHKDNRSPEIAVDEAGQVWAGLENGVARLDPVADTFLLDSQILPNGVFFLSARGEGSVCFMTLDTATREFLIGWRDADGSYLFEPLPIDQNNPEPGKAFNEEFPPFGMLPLGKKGLVIINKFGWATKESAISDWGFSKLENGNNILDFRAIAFDHEGNLWLNHVNAISCIDTASKTIITYNHDPGNPNSILSLNRLAFSNSLFVDRQGVLWSTHYGQGISTLNLYSADFGLLMDQDGLKVPDVLSALELEDGSYFIGTRTNTHGLYHYDAAGRIIQQYNSSSFRAPVGRTISEELSHPFAWSLATTRDGSLWVGTGWPQKGDGGLNRIRPGQKDIIRFKHDPDDPNSLPDDWVRQLLVDRAGRLWIHTMNSGWCWLDPEREIFTPEPDLRTLGMPDNRDLENKGLINREGNLVMGYQNQYFEVDHTTLDIIPYARLTDTTIKMEYILQDDLGRLWFINKSGFGYAEAPFKDIAYFFDITKGNFPADEVNTLNLDNDGFLWLATRNGIVRFDIEQEEWVHFGYERGLQDYFFRSRVNHKGPSGRIYFSGTGGVNIIDPEKIRINPFPPEMVFTRLRLDEKDVVPGTDSPLQRSIEMAESITVGPETLVISIDFAAIHFAGINANRYQYKLEGFDADWRDGGSLGNATYTNLSNGHYLLRVRGSNLDGIWSDGSKSIAIHILPPWWKTWWAYTLYFLALLLVGWRLHRYQKARTIRKERERSQRRELEQAKVIEKAYTELKATQAQLIHSEKMASLGELTAGIAHEIQNPLNFVNNFSDVSVEMMEELTDEMKKGNREEAEAIATDLKQNLEKIHHHGQRASGIVRGMLEHSRAGDGEKVPTDINALADEYLRLAYHGLRAKDKSFQADYRLEPDKNLPPVKVVPQDLGRVVLNLINNAFYAVSERKKTAGDDFKPAVAVRTSMRGGQVEIRVTDNGNGIPREVKEKIFQPFFTTKPTGQGTGLGLSLSFDIITKGHGGVLSVETAEGKGTTFIIQIPVKN